MIHFHLLQPAVLKIISEFADIHVPEIKIAKATNIVIQELYSVAIAAIQILVVWTKVIYLNWNFQL